MKRPRKTPSPLKGKIKAKPDTDRRLRQADRLGRLLRVLERLQSRGRWDAKAIATDLEVSERTVYRDLTALQLAGVPWLYDEKAKSYRLLSDYRFPTLNLTDDELLGQATAANLTKASGLDINRGADATARKLATGSERAEKLLTAAQNLIGVLDLQLVNHREHREIIKTIQAALLDGKQIAGSYCTPYQGRPVKITLVPYRLVLVKACWYLIACPQGRDTPRTYRATRFQSLQMLDLAAQVPNDFDLRAYFGNAWAVYRGDRTYQIKLLFQPQAASIVTETIWHPTQDGMKHADGSVTLIFQVDGLQEIATWVVSWSRWVKVIEPVELREMVIEQHRLAVEQYSRCQLNPTV